MLNKFWKFIERNKDKKEKTYTIKATDLMLFAAGIETLVVGLWMLVQLIQLDTSGYQWPSYYSVITILIIGLVLYSFSMYRLEHKCKNKEYE
jgi:hypothetical protein